MADKVTINDTLSLTEILRAAQTNAQVKRLDEPSGTVFVGTARSIGDDTGNFARSDDDIRDCFLRVTLNTGWEAFWPVRELMREVASGHFVACRSDES